MTPISAGTSLALHCAAIRAANGPILSRSLRGLAVCAFTLGLAAAVQGSGAGNTTPVAPGATTRSASNSAPAPASATAPAASASAQSWLALQRVLKTACQHDSDCNSLGVGYRGCGGPQQYIAWSVLHTDAVALREAAARYERASRKEAQARGEMSTCQLLPDPGAMCRHPVGAAVHSPGRCELRPILRGSGGGDQR